MSFETSPAGRDLLARLKNLIRDYPECMEAWDFIKEALQGQSVKHFFAWATMDEAIPSGGEPVETTKVLITSDRGFFDFAFSGGRRRCALTRLSMISGIEESGYLENGGGDRPLPAIRARLRRQDGEAAQDYRVQGMEDTELFRDFLRGLRQQLLK